MIKIAIVEDELKERELIKQYLTRYSDEFTVTEFSSAVDFLTNFQPQYDIVFMDIDMPYLDGMKASRKLRELDDRVCLIFVTNLARMAINGYEVSAFDFIVKPISYANFSLKLKRAIANLDLKRAKSIVIRSGNFNVKVAVEDILYVEISGHNLTYHTRNKNVTAYGTLLKAEELIADELFVRCNNCYLVNLRHVSTIQNGYAVVGNDKLVVSSPKKAAFEKALTDYLCGGV